MSAKRKSIYNVTEQGWQYCEHCKQDTWHTPKLGLVGSNRRLCTMCNSSNRLNYDKLTTLINRLEKIGITIECVSNVPWIYLDKVNGKKVTEVGNGGNHGYVIAWLPTKRNEQLKLTDNMSEVFDLIRKYCKDE